MSADKSLKVETNLQHSWTAKFETNNILINGKGVWFPLETDLNGDILITQGDYKDYKDLDEIGAIYQYNVDKVFEEKNDKGEKEKPYKKICGINKEVPHARISVGYS